VDVHGTHIIRMSYLRREWTKRRRERLLIVNRLKQLIQATRLRSPFIHPLVEVRAGGYICSVSFLCWDRPRQ
jgi:hypothetical protein